MHPHCMDFLQEAQLMLTNLRDALLDICSRHSGFVTSFAITNNDGRSVFITSPGGRKKYRQLVRRRTALSYVEGGLTNRRAGSYSTDVLCFQTEFF